MVYAPSFTHLYPPEQPTRSPPPDTRTLWRIFSCLLFRGHDQNPPLLSKYYLLLFSPFSLPFSLRCISPPVLRFPFAPSKPLYYRFSSAPFLIANPFPNPPAWHVLPPSLISPLPYHPPPLFFIIVLYSLFVLPLFLVPLDATCLLPFLHH